MAPLYSLLFALLSLCATLPMAARKPAKNNKTCADLLRLAKSTVNARHLFTLKALFYESLLDKNYLQAQAIIIIISQDTSKLAIAHDMQKELNSVFDLQDQEAALENLVHNDQEPAQDDAQEPTSPATCSYETSDEY